MKRRGSKKRKVLFGELEWTSVNAHLDGDDGILELDEVEGVDVEYENGVPRFTVGESKAEANVKGAASVPSVPELGDAPECMRGWLHLGLHAGLLHGLAATLAQPSTPTAIQEAVISSGAMSVLATAPTGSGKTLAFMLPILDDLLRRPPEAYTVQALVLLPTRELALQVVQHTKAALSAVNGTGIPVISVAAIVGGMSAQKQKRILDRGVHVLVGTPGRVWDVVEGNESLRAELAELRALVLDEADRMVQKGSFGEVERILGVARAARRAVFSATMSRAGLGRVKNKNKKRRADDDDMLGDIVALMDDFDPLVIAEQQTMSTLTNTHLPVLPHTRDLLLYTLLLLYPLRTIIFLPSIPSIRRLLPLLTLLLPSRRVLPLHSSLPQPTRLNSVSSFTSSPASILLATDLAARGLDLPIDLVVSYTPAPSPSTHIHRLGRTARSGKSGYAVTLVAPPDAASAAAIWRATGGEPPKFDGIRPGLEERVRERVKLAKQIDSLIHTDRKGKADKKWERQAADALGVQLSDDEQVTVSSKKLNHLKDQLTTLLKQPIVPRGVSLRYPTAQIAHDAITGNALGSIVGIRKENLVDAPTIKKRT